MTEDPSDILHVFCMDKGVTGDKIVKIDFTKYPTNRSEQQELDSVTYAKMAGMNHG